MESTALSQLDIEAELRIEKRKAALQFEKDLAAVCADLALLEKRARAIDLEPVRDPLASAHWSATAASMACTLVIRQLSAVQSHRA